MTTVCINLTLNWQGKSLTQIEKFAEFRDYLEKKFGVKWPVTHFINPRYWLHQPHNGLNELYKAYRPDTDEVGVLVHCWHDLVRAAGVKPITGHSLTRVDDGFSTPLGLYSAKAVNDIIAFHKMLLLCQLPHARLGGFRCGCGLANDKVLTGVMHNQFSYDSSATPPAIVSSGYSQYSSGTGRNIRGHASPNKGYRLYHQLISLLWGYQENTLPNECKNELIKLWNPQPSITPMSQPFKLTQGKYQLWLLPNNGGMTDYINSRYLINTFQRLQHKAAYSQLQHLNIGCQLETITYGKKALLPFVEYLVGEEDHQFAK